MTFDQAIVRADCVPYINKLKLDRRVVLPPFEDTLVISGKSIGGGVGLDGQLFGTDEAKNKYQQAEQ